MSRKQKGILHCATIHFNCFSVLYKKLLSTVDMKHVVHVERLVVSKALCFVEINKSEKDKVSKKFFACE